MRSPQNIPDELRDDVNSLPPIALISDIIYIASCVDLRMANMMLKHRYEYQKETGRWDVDVSRGDALWHHRISSTISWKCRDCKLINRWEFTGDALQELQLRQSRKDIRESRKTYFLY